MEAVVVRYSWKQDLLKETVYWRTGHRVCPIHLILELSHVTQLKSVYKVLYSWKKVNIKILLPVFIQTMRKAQFIITGNNTLL